jgi:hypothetical protein
MKTSFKVLFIIVSLLTVTLMLDSCKHSKKIAKENTKYTRDDEEFVNVLCSGEEFHTDDEYFRANDFGESTDMTISKKKALANARANLAAQIEVIISGMTDNYVKSLEINNVEKVTEHFEVLNREILDQTLKGTRTICEKVTETKKGKFRTYVAIELAEDEIFEMYKNRISVDEEVKASYDYEKFRNSYEEALQKHRITTPI